MTCSRRDFLKSMVGTASFLSLAPAVPAFLHNAVAAAEGNGSDRDTVLVVLQLSGGNDGLNTVVPYADDVYGRSRDTLRLTPSQVIKIDSYLGFHPELKDFHRMLQDRTLTVVHGVGYPKSNRDHDAAMREWHTARPGEPQCPTGWVGRAVDQIDSPAAPVCRLLSSVPSRCPFALNAEASVIPAVRTTATVDPRVHVGHTGRASEASPGVAAGARWPLVIRCKTWCSLPRKLPNPCPNAWRKCCRPVPPLPTYPSFTLAQQLQMVAQLIRADLGIRIYFVELGGGGIGGFDNHANQRDNHAALLREMSVSIGAFMDDLKREKLISRVLLMTFSEFGRTVSENGRRGTDHGAAAPVFLVGGRVKGGLHGKHPSLTDLDQDALKFQVDYRSLYATVLQSWLGFEPVRCSVRRTSRSTSSRSTEFISCSNCRPSEEHSTGPDAGGIDDALPRRDKFSVRSSCRMNRHFDLHCTLERAARSKRLMMCPASCRAQLCPSRGRGVSRRRPLVRCRYRSSLTCAYSQESSHDVSPGRSDSVTGSRVALQGARGVDGVAAFRGRAAAAGGLDREHDLGVSGA